jgi:hypothetical protein
MEYFICHSNQRLLGPMKKEDAIKELFKLKGSFEGLYILQIDKQTGKIEGKIGPK